MKSTRKKHRSPLRVVQCWDDGIEDDIQLIEILRKHGAKATFNLCPGLHRSPASWVYGDKTVRTLPLTSLTEVYRGFTIANHSMSHPRPLTLSRDQWRLEVEDARKQLQDIFNDPIHGFVYPFGDWNQSVAQVVQEAGHLYARTVKNTTPCFPPENPFAFGPDCHFRALDFQQRYQQAKESPSRIFYFWGHSYELVSPQDWQNMDNLIAQISADPEAEWADLPSLFQ